MKIALFHNLPAGGAKRALFDHARALQARGHTLDAHVMATTSEDFLPLAPLCRRVYTHPVPFASSPASSGWPGGRIGRIVRGYRNFRRDLRALELMEDVYRAVAREIDALDYDLVYVHHCRFLLSPYLLRVLKTPTVYFCQDTLREAHEWTLDEQNGYDTEPERFGRRRIRGRFVSPLQERLLHEREQRNADNARAATLTLANSWYSREALLRAYGINARVCYLGVDGDFFRPPAHNAPRREGVLSVGNLGLNKRHEFVLDAVASIPEARRPPLRIIGYEVIGTETGFGGEMLGPLARGLVRRAQERGVALTIDKEVSDEALRDAYQQAGVVAFAPHLEPFGFVTLEAMASGAPVVGVPEAGLRETIEDGVTGLLSHRDPLEYGSALDRVLQDRALAVQLGANGREVALCRWTWERSTDTLEGLFDIALGRHRPHALNLPQEVGAECVSR